MRFKPQARISMIDDLGKRVEGEIDELVFEDRSIKAMWVKLGPKMLALFAPNQGGQDQSGTYTLTFRCNPWK